MATCPKCGRALTDGHRCFGGWREAGRFAFAAIVGALLGWVGSLVAFENPSHSLILVVTLLGAVLAPAVWQSLR